MDKDQQIEQLKQQVSRLELLNNAFMLVASNYLPHTEPHDEKCLACLFLSKINEVAKELGWK